MSSTVLLPFKIAYRALRINKVRTFLAILGVTIGMASIIIVYSAGAGVEGLLLGQIEAFGSDVIETEIKVPSNKTGYESERQNAMNLLQGAQVTTLTLDDMEDLNKLVGIKNGYAAVMGQESVSHDNELRRTIILGSTASYIEVDRAEIKEGRYFTEFEDRSLAQVVILGTSMKQKLFGMDEAIGQSIRIRKTRFRVIGVMKELGAVMGLDFDDFVYVPVRTLQKKVMGINYVHYMIHQVYDVTKTDQAAAEMRQVLRDNHDIPAPVKKRLGWTDTGRDDFRVVSMAEISDVYGSLTDTLTILLLAIVAVSLVVGGVGIMNVMYVIVNERTSEIGLRKAVGASYSNIMWQFLIESILITLIGGIIGIIFGLMMAYLISFGANASGLDWRFIVPPKAYVTALIFSIVFGVLFGIFPARRAARLDPLEALRKQF